MVSELRCELCVTLHQVEEAGLRDEPAQAWRATERLYREVWIYGCGLHTLVL